MNCTPTFLVIMGSLPSKQKHLFHQWQCYQHEKSSIMDKQVECKSLISDLIDNFKFNHVELMEMYFDKPPIYGEMNVIGLTMEKCPYGYDFKGDSFVIYTGNDCRYIDANKIGLSISPYESHLHLFEPIVMNKTEIFAQINESNLFLPSKIVNVTLYVLYLLIQMFICARTGCISNNNQYTQTILFIISRYNYN